MTRLAILTSHPIQYYAPLFRELAKQVDVHVFFAYRPTATEQGAAGFGVPFEWDIDLTDGYSNEFLHNRAKAPASDSFAGCDTPEIADKLRVGRFDALLVTGWGLKSYWQGIVAARQQGIATLVRGDSQLGTPRSWIKRSIKHALYPRLLRAFDAALYVGTKSKAYYESYHYPAGRLFYSPHCVEAERFAAAASGASRAALRQQLGISDTDPVVLFAGKLLPFKRPLDVIDAVSRVRSERGRVHVMVAGSGPLDRELRVHAAAEGVSLHMLGFRNQSQMPESYVAADLLVLPSTGRETWGLVCNEALAAGIPIVVSDAAGCAADLAADGIAGRVFAVGDVQGCARAISSLLAEPPSRDAIARKSDSHSMNNAIEGILAALKATTRQRVDRISSDRSLPC